MKLKKYFLRVLASEKHLITRNLTKQDYDSLVYYCRKNLDLVASNTNSNRFMDNTANIYQYDFDSYLKTPANKIKHLGSLNNEIYIQFETKVIFGLSRCGKHEVMEVHYKLD